MCLFFAFRWSWARLGTWILELVFLARVLWARRSEGSWRPGVNSFVASRRSGPCRVSERFVHPRTFGCVCCRQEDRTPDFRCSGSDLLDLRVKFLFSFAAVVFRQVPGRGSCDCRQRPPGHPTCYGRVGNCVWCVAAAQGCWPFEKEEGKRAAELTSPPVR